MNYVFTHSAVEGKPSTYRIAWEKDGVEVVSSEVTLAGTEEGVETALRFAADDLRQANPDLFIPDPAEMHFEDREEVEDAVN